MTGVTGSAPAIERERIYETYPGRDGHGYVTGHYVYNRRGGYRVAGPFPSRAAALEARAVSQRLELDTLDVIVGHVFTTVGTIIRTASSVSYRAVWVERMPGWDDVAPARRAAYEIRHAVEILAGVSGPGDRVSVSDGRGARSVRRADLVDVTVSARVEAVPA